MKENIIKYFKKEASIVYCCVIGLILGTLAFLMIYGYSTLNVTYDSWIYNGYIEPDIVCTYSGWLNYRNSPWQFPLFLASNLGSPTGTVILFTDSIPLVCLIFKALSPILPETFQFIGIYVLLCFILQGISSAVLIKLFTKNKLTIFIATILFVISPIMIERAFRHSSFASHWLIIFALYLLIKSKKEGYSKFKWKFILLNILAIGISPYIMAIVMGILCATMLGWTIKNRKIVKPILFFGTNIACTVLFGYAVGAFGGGGVESLGGGGFGYFSMNLNSIINPTSAGIPSWSAFIKTHSQILGNYDSFNYLGAGVLIFIIVICINWLMQYQKGNELSFFKRSIQYIKNNIEIILMCSVFFLFAISNVITLNSKIIIQYTLPKKIMDFCSIFRSSGRLFWPVYYLIFLYIIKNIVQNFKKNRANTLILLLVMIQLIDISPILVQKYKYFNSGVIENATEFSSEGWKFIGNNYSKLSLLTPSKEVYGKDYGVAAFAGKYRMQTNVAIANRGTNLEVVKNRESDIRNIIDGNLDTEVVYITEDDMLFNKLIYNVNFNDNCIACDLGNFKAIIPKKDGISLENISNKVKVLNYSQEDLSKLNKFNVVDFSDENWNKGVSTNDNILLFPYTYVDNKILSEAKQVRVGDYMAEIKSVTSISSTWIHVEIEGDKEKFAYPNKIEIVR